MSFTFRVENLGALDRFVARFRMLINPDATPLMATWCKIIEDDNKKGVLAGLDKDGSPLAPVTYRPIPPTSKLTVRQKNLVQGNRRGVFAGLGASPGGYTNNNLTSSEYRRLGGPPLAPRGRPESITRRPESFQ